MPVRCRFASVAADIVALSLPLWLFVSVFVCLSLLLVLLLLGLSLFLSLSLCLSPFNDAALICFVRFIWNRSIPFTVSIAKPHYNRFIECSIEHRYYAGKRTRVLEIVRAASRQTILWYLYVFIRFHKCRSVSKFRRVTDATVAMSSCAHLTWCCLEIERQRKRENE